MSQFYAAPPGATVLLRPSQIILRSIKAIESDRLVASETGCLANVLVTEAAVIEIAFGSGNKR